MEPLLRAESFAGEIAGDDLSRPAIAGEAMFHGCVACFSWQRDEVSALLPAGLELAQAATEAAEHPVLFLFGEQSAGATFFGGMKFPWGVRYHEFGLAIPFVQHRLGRKLHTFIARMYSSYFPAVWHGKAHYGFGKEMMEMRWSGPLFLMTTPAGDLLFHAAVEPSGEWVSGRGCHLPNFDAVREMFALPILGRRADGVFLGSYFDWDFSAARVRPLRAAVTVDAPLAPGLAPGRSFALPDATFEVEHMRWRLSWPSPPGL